MGMLLMLKEGGSLLIDTIGNKPIDEDLDLLPETASGTMTLAFRVMTNSISVTSSTSSKSRAIVLGV